MRNTQAASPRLAKCAYAAAASSIAIAVCLGGTAVAQDQSGGLTDQIVVTAQKREQNEQDVGISINVFSGAEVKALNVEQSFDIANFTPGVHISGNLAGQNTQFTIRGVTQNDFNDIIEAPNAVYLDDAYIAVAQGQTFAAFDVERVEILKGPQGTLFGRNATGGLVHYISNKPVIGEVGGYADVTYGRFDSPAHANQVRVEGALNMPLSDTAAARASILYNYQDPYLKNLYPDSAVGGTVFPGFGPNGFAPGPDAGADLGDDDTLAGRFQLLFEPQDNFRAIISFNAARSRMATGPYQSKSTIGIFDANGELINTIDTPANETRFSIQLEPDGSDAGGAFGTDQNNDGVFGNPEFGFGPTSRPVPGGDFFGYLDPDGRDFTFSGDFAFEDSGSTDTWGIGGKLEFDLSDNVLLTSITDYKEFEKLLFIDVDSAPVNQLVNYAGVDAQTFSQELRLNGSTPSLDWVLGLYYLNIDSTSDNGLKIPAGSVAIAPGGGPIDVGVDATLKTNSYSIFGQTEWEFAPQWTLLTGVRVIQENKDVVVEQNLYASLDARTIHQGDPIVQIGPIDPVAMAPATFTASPNDTHWAGKVQLEYRPTDALMLYAGVSRGVKAGSFNAPIDGGIPVPDEFATLPYDREVLVSYEGGFKSSFWDGRARLNGTFFYYDYSDYQAFLFTGVAGLVINADAENYGGEIELQANPMPGLDVILGLSAFDATVKDVPLRIGDDPNIPIRDVEPVYAPELQANAIVRYEWPFLGGMASILGSLVYSDEYFYNLRNFDADKFDDYYVLNSRLGWVSPDDRWELAFSVNNITDERIGVQGFNLATLCGCNEISFQPPRWYGFNVRLNY